MTYIVLCVDSATISIVSLGVGGVLILVVVILVSLFIIFRCRFCRFGISNTCDNTVLQAGQLADSYFREHQTTMKLSYNQDCKSIRINVYWEVLFRTRNKYVLWNAYLPNVVAFHTPLSKYLTVIAMTVN